MLTGPEILRQIHRGKINIEPLDRTLVGPNSVNLRLSPELLIMKDPSFDLKIAPAMIERVVMPPEGYWLEPGIGYLGATVERITCRGYVPWIDGRSTCGRYFFQVHVTAGKGDDGFSGTFTLEMMAMYRPLCVYPGLPICQVFFFPVIGQRQPYKGRYLGQTGPRPPQPLTGGV